MQFALVLVSLAASLVLAQDINTVPACGQSCFNSMKGKLGCAPADQKCLCDKADYRNGLKDCVNQSCGADTGPATSALNVYVDAICAAAAAPAAPSSAPPAPSTSAAPPPPPPSSTSAPSTPPPAPATTSSSSTSTSAAAPATTTSSSSSSTSSSSRSSSSSSSSATSSPTPEPTKESSAEGLSGTAKIGISIGGAAAALGLIGVLICVFLHRRNQRHDSDQLRRLKISDPMPGAGRTYAGDHFNDKYQTNSRSDIDFKSRRYEDMLPRQMPRNMV